MMEVITLFHPHLMEQFPYTNVVMQNVFALPQLQNYLSTRPSTADLLAHTGTMFEIRKQYFPWLPKNAPNQKKLQWSPIMSIPFNTQFSSMSTSSGLHTYSSKQKLGFTKKRKRISKNQNFSVQKMSNLKNVLFG